MPYAESQTIRHIGPYTSTSTCAIAGVDVGHEVALTFHTARFGEFWWAWNSSDPA